MPDRIISAEVRSGLRHRHVVTLVVGFAVLAPNRRRAVLNAWHTGATWLCFRLSWRRRRLRRMQIVCSGQRFGFHIRDFVDLCVAEEVFLREVYAMPELDGVSLILDLGSHIGLSVLWFRAKFPTAAIHAVEPDPESFALLQRNTAGLARVTLQNAAVGGSTRTAEFFPSAQNWLSSLVPDQTRQRAAAIPVRVEPLSAILADLGTARADIVKLDVEGAEWEILDSIRLDSVADHVVGEFHSHGAPGTRPAAGLPRLGSFALQTIEDTPDRCVFVATSRVRRQRVTTDA